ncbi:MAG: YybH family protein [Acidobacteriota bacterium]
MRSTLVSVAVLVLGAVCAPSAWAATTAELAAEVSAAETAFAATMARRDLAAFGVFVAEEALFFGRSRVLRGRAAVVEGWRPYFDGPQAPFSWAPETVEVLDSGTLALSSGPVRDPSGAVVGSFVSTWRREPDGAWRVVLDKGCPPCDCPPKP